MTVIANAKERFSNRVENYIRYRPGYPDGIVPLLQTKCGLRADSVIADIGSGTGILSRIFLVNGNTVFGVEPNKEMREAAERLLRSWTGFKSVDGSAEATTLATRSVHLAMAGQAFHWFDREACRREFARILRPKGWVVLIWNDRKTEATAFLRDYEQLLHTYATDYAKVDHKRIDEQVLQAFFQGTPAKAVLPNFQQFDFEGLRGRLLSSSYVPEHGEPGHAEMLTALRRLFDEHQHEGQVTIEYDTLVYYGQLPEHSAGT